MLIRVTVFLGLVPPLSVFYPGCRLLVLHHIIHCNSGLIHKLLPAMLLSRVYSHSCQAGRHGGKAQSNN